MSCHDHGPGSNTHFTFLVLGKKENGEISAENYPS